jgi:ribosomal-protein-alanine N-acetyltransferase
VAEGMEKPVVVVPGLRIRPMARTDLPSVLTIERASFPVPWSSATFRSLLRRRDAHLWVAEVGGEVVGYAAVWVVLDQAELGDLAVVAGSRRQGIGTRLLEAVVGRLAELGVRQLFLEVRESNRAAQRLYTRHGFIEVGRRAGYYSSPREDALVLERPIRAGGARQPVS